MKNLQEYSQQIPEMVLLVKDYKHWHISSGKPVPSRPVISGNNCLNTHLSEITAEILEPISLKIGSGETSSTEEALALINEYNDKILKGTPVEDINGLEQILGADSLLNERLRPGFDSASEKPNQTLPDIRRSKCPNDLVTVSDQSKLLLLGPGDRPTSCTGDKEEDREKETFTEEEKGKKRKRKRET